MGVTRRLALRLEYEGTRYHGFQWQTKVPTVQGEIEQALQSLCGERIRVTGASRTDAGVHALGQVVSFLTHSALGVEAFVGGLNHFLPQDIAVRAAREARADFHARRDALGRVYRYSILQRATRSPLLQRYAARVSQALEGEAMHRAGQVLVGSHDFAGFAGPLEGPRKSTMRNLYRVEVKEEGELLNLEIEGNAFLPQQVRRMAGALVQVGLGKMGIEGLHALLDGAVKGTAGPLLPACGLCLVRVNYPEGDNF